MNQTTKRKKKHKAPTPRLSMNTKMHRHFSVYKAVVLCVLCTTTVCAADDPIAVVNNLSTFIFGLVRAVGMILIGYGIVQIGLSLKSHDPSQRANGIMTVAGGIVVTFAKEILNTIAG